MCWWVDRSALRQAKQRSDGGRALRPDRRRSEPSALRRRKHTLKASVIGHVCHIRPIDRRPSVCRGQLKYRSKALVLQPQFSRGVLTPQLLFPLRSLTPSSLQITTPSAFRQAALRPPPSLTRTDTMALSNTILRSVLTIVVICARCSVADARALRGASTTLVCARPIVGPCGLYLAPAGTEQWCCAPMCMWAPCPPIRSQQTAGFDRATCRAPLTLTSTGATSYSVAKASGGSATAFAYASSSASSSGSPANPKARGSTPSNPPPAETASTNGAAPESPQTASSGERCHVHHA